MAFQQSDAVEIKRIRGKGRGVFARRPIRKGEVIERVPVIVLSLDEYAKSLGQGVLKDYCFAWGKNQVALALGYGSLYNHSYQPNARYEDDGPSSKAFIARRAIAEGEEITVNYNGKPGSRAKVWFDVVEASGSKKEEGPGGELIGADPVDR